MGVSFSWWAGAVAVLPVVAVLGEPAAAAEFSPAVLEITTDTELDPQVAYGRIVVKASGVVIEGNGAVLVGPAAAAGKAQWNTGAWRCWLKASAM